MNEMRKLMETVEPLFENVKVEHYALDGDGDWYGQGTSVTISPKAAGEIIDTFMASMIVGRFEEPDWDSIINVLSKHGVLDTSEY